MGKGSVLLKLGAVFTAAVISISSLCAAGAENAADSSVIKTVASSAGSETAYDNYYTKHLSDARPSENIKVLPRQYDENTDGQQAVMLSPGKSFESDFTAAEAGVYYINVSYHTVSEDSLDIQVKILIDGKLPFDEAERMELPRFYRDAVSNGRFETDKYGNDIRPSSEEVDEWRTHCLQDNSSLYEEPYLFYLEAGAHTLSISTENTVAVSYVELCNPAKPISYSEYIKKCENTATGDIIRHEAEMLSEKNSKSIYPTYDKANASTLPSSSSSIKLNTIGQSNWSRQGQSVSWKPDIKNAGLYSITLRVNQSYNENSSSYRRLLINGEIPFAEVESVEFPYDVNWYMKTFGDDKPYYFYLKPGDTVTLECVADSTCSVSRNINGILSDLSAVYREIFVIVGASPDMYTDYNLDVKIPTLTDELKSISKQLNSAVNDIISINGKKTSSASTLCEVLETVDKMIARPYDIQRYITDVSDDITSLGSLVMSIGQQPLELDCLYFTSKGEKIPSGQRPFAKRILYHLQRYINSYMTDYGAFGTDSGKLKVWVSTGRDQLQIIQRMIENDFESTHDTRIELSLVDTGATLLKAVISGKGPDVALSIENGTPVNLAIRGALVDLKNYGVQELFEDFYSSAWTPYELSDSIYAIPETQLFDVMFYRTDVFEVLEIEPPSTWDDFYTVLETLQRNNYEIGIPEVGANAGVSSGISTFARFLLQNGGTYYTPDFRKTAFDSDYAYSAFNQWVELYRKYGLDRSFDFFNRFRTGVMALSIQPYSTYNQLYAAAPEIRGLWAMAPVPGKQDEDGKINRSENSSGTGCIMLKSAEKKGLGKQAYEFMKWWTGNDAQLKYENELEATMGIAARYTPANKYAFENVGWKSAELAILSEQAEHVVNFREVPGNYVLPRALTSAFRKALLTGDMPERQLELYNKDINAELERKAEEFNLY